MAFSPNRPSLLPFEVVLKCRKSFKKPREYRGEWPRRNRCYVADVFTPAGSEKPRVFVRGLLANEPHASFPIGYWQWVATVWLN